MNPDIDEKIQTTGMTREQLLDIERQTKDFIADLDNLPPVKHNWIDRGAKYTCENAGHAMHEAWKRKFRG